MQCRILVAMVDLVSIWVVCLLKTGITQTKCSHKPTITIPAIWRGRNCKGGQAQTSSRTTRIAIKTSEWFPVPWTTAQAFLSQQLQSHNKTNNSINSITSNSCRWSKARILASLFLRAVEPTAETRTRSRNSVSKAEKLLSSPLILISLTNLYHPIESQLPSS